MAVVQQLAGIQATMTQMVELFGKLTPLIEAQANAMDNLGESAKKTKEDMEKTKTFLGKIIGDSESGFFRKTTGKTGFFHRMMYGVDGYFIFKNRLDGLLSFIDNAVVRPLSGLGDKKDGFMSSVLMGVKEDYDKAEKQISKVRSLIKEQRNAIKYPRDKRYSSYQSPVQRGISKAKSTAENLGNKINTSSKAALEFFTNGNKRREQMTKFNNYLGSKGAGLMKMAKSSLKVLMTMGLVVMKYLIIAGLAITGVFVLIKLLRKAGLDGAKLKEIGLGMYNIAKHFVVKIWENLTKMKEGLLLIYDFVFGDGTFGDLIEGYIMVIGGFIGAVWNLFLAIAVPIYYAGIEILKLAIIGLKNKAIDYFNSNFKKPLMKALHFISGIFVILGLVVLSIGAAMGIAAGLPLIIAGAVVAGVMYAINKLTKPFANGGVTKSGLSMVGERGPELVRLPNGSRVHTNQESKRMMTGGGGNNITVNIQGRIGASDSELRQIAQKVGQMINKEINRTTSSRGLGA